MKLWFKVCYVYELMNWYTNERSCKNLCRIILQKCVTKNNCVKKFGVPWLKIEIEKWNQCHFGSREIILMNRGANERSCRNLLELFNKYDGSILTS